MDKKDEQNLTVGLDQTLPETPRRDRRDGPSLPQSHDLEPIPSYFLDQRERSLGAQSVELRILVLKNLLKLI